MGTEQDKTEQNQTASHVRLPVLPVVRTQTGDVDPLPVHGVVRVTALFFHHGHVPNRRPVLQCHGAAHAPAGGDRVARPVLPHAHPPHHSVRVQDVLLFVRPKRPRRSVQLWMNGFQQRALQPPPKFIGGAHGVECHWEGCRGVIVPGERCVKQGRLDAVAGVVRMADASPVKQTHRGHQQEQTMKRQFATRGAFVRQLFRRIGIPTQGTKFTFLARVPRQVKQRTQFWGGTTRQRGHRGGVIEVLNVLDALRVSARTTRQRTPNVAGQYKGEMCC
jgi:hypothetical protein